LKIWIDIVNAPHAWFFKSIINFLENECEEVFITARKYGDVLQLLGVEIQDVHGGS